jgi:hypothetical protein
MELDARRHGSSSFAFYSLKQKAILDFASPIVGCRLALPVPSSALKDDLATDQRQICLDVLNLSRQYSHVVRGEHHQVGELSGLDRPLSHFLECYVARTRYGRLMAVIVNEPRR